MRSIAVCVFEKNAETRKIIKRNLQIQIANSKGAKMRQIYSLQVEYFLAFIGL